MNDDAQTPQDTNARTVRTLWLADNFHRWCRQPYSKHLVCVLVLVMVPLLRWWPALTNGTEPLGDEPAYQAAFSRVANGQSPYGGTDFVYPAVFAFAGAKSVDLIGLEYTMYALRGANLLGLAIVLWCSMAWLAWPLAGRLALGAAVILLAPQVSLAVLLGNVSLTVAGLVVGSLLAVPRAPVTAGLALGASIALKPVAPMAVACLAAATHEAAPRARWIAAGGAAFVVLVLLGAFPYMDQLIALQATDRVATSVSLHRVPKVLGFDVNALWLSVPLALVALSIVRKLELGRARFLCFATTASLVVLPLVWSHTLILLLPLQMLALYVAVDRVRGSSNQGHSASRWLEPVLVVLAVASLQFSAGAGVIDDQGVVVQLAGALLPALAPIGLLAYLLGHTEAF